VRYAWGDLKSWGRIAANRGLQPRLSMGFKRASVATIFGIAVLTIFSRALADPYPVGVLRVLDKVTARSTVVDVPLDQPLRFGTLELVVRHCDKRPPEETPEAAAFLEIWELRKNESVRRVFEGWMYASTPGLSALEHPVYDVWVLDCVSAEQSEPAASSSEILE